MGTMMEASPPQFMTVVLSTATPAVMLEKRFPEGGWGGSGSSFQGQSTSGPFSASQIILLSRMERTSSIPSWARLAAASLFLEKEKSANPLVMSETGPTTAAKITDKAIKISRRVKPLT